MPFVCVLAAIYAFYREEHLSFLNENVPCLIMHALLNTSILLPEEDTMSKKHSMHICIA